MFYLGLFGIIKIQQPTCVCIYNYIYNIIQGCIYIYNMHIIFLRNHCASVVRKRSPNMLLELLAMLRLSRLLYEHHGKTCLIPSTSHLAFQYPNIQWFIIIFWGLGVAEASHQCWAPQLWRETQLLSLPQLLTRFYCHSKVVLQCFSMLFNWTTYCRSKYGTQSRIQSRVLHTLLRWLLPSRAWCCSLASCDPIPTAFASSLVSSGNEETHND